MLHADHTPYFRYTNKSRLEKAINSLVGIVGGITIDHKLNDKELAFLFEWLRQNQELKERHPFNELFPLVFAASKDRVFGEPECLDLLWLCNKLLSNTEFYDQVTSEIQVLHGLLGGVIADGIITEMELEGLREWLCAHEHLRTIWPYDEIDSVITAVMADGQIDADEHTMLLALFSDFLALYDDRTLSRPPVLIENTIVGLCSVCPEISFAGTTFCFTGASSRYRRRELETLIQSLGGVFAKNVTSSTDYLVIGAEGNPCWAYACYGRKVEAAVRLRKEGHRLVMVHENDFHDAVADMGMDRQ